MDPILDPSLTSSVPNTSIQSPLELNTTHQTDIELVHSKKRKSQPEEKSTKKRGKNFTHSEDEQLCHSYISISTDRIIGKSQKILRLWQRIKEHYKNNKVPQPSDSPCDSTTLQKRWSHISTQVTKFVNHHSVAVRNLRSGKLVGAGDAIMDAKETFLAETGENFTLEHCWVILRDTKKFQDTSENTLAPFPSSPTSSKISNTMSATPSNTSQVPKRPSGTKTAKKEAASSKTQEELDRAVLQASEKLADAVAEKGIAIRDLSESRIMMEDPEKMSGHRREWYQMKQEEIMGRYKKVKTNHQTKSKTSQTDGDLQTDLDLQTESESQTNQTDGHWDKE